MHARIGNLGPVLSLDHGLRGPRRHRLGLRVGSQRSHDGCSDGGRRSVVLQDWLNHDTVYQIYFILKLKYLQFCDYYYLLLHLPFSLMLSSVLEGHSSHSGALRGKQIYVRHVIKQAEMYILLIINESPHEIAGRTIMR